MLYLKCLFKLKRGIRMYIAVYIVAVAVFIFMSAVYISDMKTGI